MKLVIVLLALVFTVKGDVCLGSPPNVGSGANCNSAVNCEPGYYCDKTSSCAPYVALEAACFPVGGVTSGPNNPCGPTAQCVAVTANFNPTGNFICVPNANPGDISGYSTLAPICQSPLFQNTTSGTCSGGLVGDYCTTNLDCLNSQNITCNNNLCVGIPVGGYCYPFNTINTCAAGSSCVQNPFNPTMGVCTQTTPAGECWVGVVANTNNNLCNAGSFCLYNAIANTSTCVPVGSLPAGSFCGTTGALCSGTLRCWKGYCASSRNTYCSSNTDCSGDEYCTCSGEASLGGYSTCQKNACLDSLSKLVACVNTTCQMSTVFSSNPVYASVFSGSTLLGGSYSLVSLPSVSPSAVSYSKSCVLLNCATQYKNYLACSAASPLVQSFFLVAIFALIATWAKF